MSNWPVNAGTRYEQLGFASGTGVSLTPGNGSKGAYATIGTTGFRYDGFILACIPGVSAVQLRVDIAINTGGSDVTVVEDFFVDVAGTANNVQNFLIPVKIPSGAVVKVRAQSTVVTAGALVVAIAGWAQDVPQELPSAKMISCTDWTGSLPTNSVAQNGVSFTAWTTICASTTNRVKELLFALTGAGDVARTAASMNIEIGIGSAGNEKTIATFCGKQASATMAAVYSRTRCDIPAGTRLSFRCQCSAAVSDTVAVAANGLIA